MHHHQHISKACGFFVFQKEAGKSRGGSTAAVVSSSSYLESFMAFLENQFTCKNIFEMILFIQQFLFFNLALLDTFWLFLVSIGLRIVPVCFFSLSCCSVLESSSCFFFFPSYLERFIAFGRTNSLLLLLSLLACRSSMLSQGFVILLKNCGSQRRHNSFIWTTTYYVASSFLFSFLCSTLPPCIHKWQLHFELCCERIL